MLDLKISKNNAFSNSLINTKKNTKIADKYIEDKCVIMKYIFIVSVFLISGACDDSPSAHIANNNNITNNSNNTNNTNNITCSNLNCGEHGTCILENEIPICDCDPGYFDTGSGCALIEDLPYFTNLPTSVSSSWRYGGSFSPQYVGVENEIMVINISDSNCSFPVSLTPEHTIEWNCGEIETCSVTVSVEMARESLVRDEEILTIQCVNNAPYFNSVPVSDATVFEMFDYHFTCLDIDSDLLTLTVGVADTCNGYIHSQLAGTGIYSFEPAAPGNCTVDIRCSDSIEEDSLSFNLEIHDIRGWAGVSAGGHHTCAVKSGELFCWGENQDGQLGVGDYTDRITPVRITSMNTFTSVSAGANHTCAVSAGSLYCWGKNFYGQLGTGDVQDQALPVMVGTDSDWSIVKASSSHTCAIKTNGELYCWGANMFGQLGCGDTVPRNNPVKIGSFNDWIEVSTGFGHTCGIIITGEIYCWGSNEQGELGLNDTTNRNSPVKVGVNTDWQSVCTGMDHTCAISGGDLYCWGYNNWSQLGLGDTTVRDQPAKVNNAGGYSMTGCGCYFSCAVTNGSVYCFGRNDTYQLGVGDDLTHSTPVLQNTVTSPMSIDGGENHACIYKNREIYCWGSNYSGQLGLGDNNNRTVPTLIP